MRELAQLLMPSVRWDPARGFEPVKPAVMRALAAGVAGFVIDSGPRDGIAELTADIRRRSETAPVFAIAPASFLAASWSTDILSIPPDAAVASLRERIAVRRVARAVAREARKAGCNAVLAPSCDVPRFVNVDAFGREASDVALAVAEWIDAAQAEGVLCVAGRFPGAGAVPYTESGIPTIREPEDAIYARDLVPFRAAIDSGVAGLLVAHLAYSALDASGAPASASEVIVGGLLRTQLGFDGLAVADAGALVTQRARRASAAQLIAAGIDVVIRPVNVDAELRALMDAVQARTLDRERVHEAAQRRLGRAELAGSPAAPNAVDSDFAWLEEAAERAISVVRGRSIHAACPVEVACAGGSADVAATIGPAFVAGIQDAGGDLGCVRQVAMPSAGTRTPLIVLLPPRPGSGGSQTADERRAAALCAEAHRLGRDAIVVWCGHPDAEPTVPGAALVIACWSPTSPMVRAAGRWLLRRT